MQTTPSNSNFAKSYKVAVKEKQRILITYLRPNEGEAPYACLIAVSPNHIGYSICHHKDQFDKKLARHIAYGRAIKNLDMPSYNRIPSESTTLMALKYSMVNEAIEREFIPRAAQYFSPNPAGMVKSVNTSDLKSDGEKSS